MLRYYPCFREVETPQSSSEEQPYVVTQSGKGKVALLDEWRQSSHIEHTDCSSRFRVVQLPHWPSPFSFRCCCPYSSVESFSEQRAFTKHIGWSRSPITLTISVRRIVEGYFESPKGGDQGAYWMLRSRFEQVMVRAVLDLPFRARLLSDPAKVLVDYGMKPTDAYLFAELHTQSLEELAGQLLRIGLEKWGIRVPGVGTYWDDGIDVFTYRAIVTRSQDIYPIPTCFVHLM